MKDTEYLKNRISLAERKSETSANSSSTSNISDQVNDFLETATSDDQQSQDLQDKNLNASLRMGSQKARLEKLQSKAEKVDASDPRRVEKREQAKQQKEVDEQIEDQDVSQVEAGRRVVTGAISSASDKIDPLIDRVGTLPTYGGLLLLVLILAILLFTVVQVNAQGDTRMKQLWYMLNGRATIKGRQNVTTSVTIPGTGGNQILNLGSGDKGVSGTFGTGSSNSGLDMSTIDANRTAAADLGF